MAKITKRSATQRGGLSPPAPLRSEHDVTRFNSGKAALDDWLRNRALQSEGVTSRTYVVCEGNVVVGYYCISTGSVERRMLPAKMKRASGLPNQISVAIIGRLARDLSYKSKGMGSDLLQDALTRILSASRIIGIRAVLVHALDDDASRFWREHEFIEYPVDSRTFYLPIETLADAL